MTGMLGFTPAEVGEMSLAQVLLAIDGFAELKRAESGAGAEVEAPSIEEVYELIRLERDSDANAAKL